MYRDKLISLFKQYRANVFEDHLLHRYNKKFIDNLLSIVEKDISYCNDHLYYVNFLSLLNKIIFPSLQEKKLESSVYNKIISGVQNLCIKDSYTLFLVNGKAILELSFIHNDIEVFSLNSSDISSLVDSITKSNDIISNFSMSFINKVSSINIKKSLDKPLHIINITDLSYQGFYDNILRYINVSSGVKADIIVSDINSNSLSWFNSFINLNVLYNANVNLYLLNQSYSNDSKNVHNSISISNCFVNQSKESKCSVLNYCVNDKYIINNIYSNLDTNAYFNTNILNYAKYSGNIHNFILAGHLKKDSHSSQQIDNIIKLGSINVLSDVLINKDACHSNSFQSINSLMITEQGSVNARPNLRIFNDDVKCNHGLTIGSFIYSHLFYLMSRGISYSDAKNLIIISYKNKLLSCIKNQSILDLFSKNILFDKI